MGNVLPLKDLKRVSLDRKNQIDVNSARIQSAIICESNNGINYADRIARAEGTEALVDTGTALKKLAQVLALGSGGAKIGEQIYMTVRMKDLRSEFTEKAQQFKNEGGDLIEFGKETGLKIGDAFKVAENFYKTAGSLQYNASVELANAHTFTNQMKQPAVDARAKFDEAIGLRDRANEMMLGAKQALADAYATTWPKGTASKYIGVAKTNYNNANKYFGQKNQEALSAQGIAQEAQDAYLEAVAKENTAIDALNTANKELYDRAKAYTDAKAEVDEYNLQVQQKLKKFNQTKSELQGVMNDIKDEQVSSNKRLALYAIGGQAGQISDSIASGIEHYVAGNYFQAVANTGVGTVTATIGSSFGDFSPYLPLATQGVNAIAYAGDTGDYKTAFWNFGDNVLGIGLMVQNINDIEAFYGAIDGGDYITAFGLSGRSLVNSWNVGCKNVGTAVSLATGIPYADKAIGVSGKVASDILATPFALGLTVEAMDNANVEPDVMAGVASLTLLGACGGMLGDVLALVDGNRFNSWWNKAMMGAVQDALEGSGVAMEEGKPVLGRDYFGLGGFIMYPDPVKNMPDPQGIYSPVNNLGLGGIQDNWNKTSGVTKLDWWLSMGYDACGGELKPCQPPTDPSFLGGDEYDVNKSIADTEASNAFMLDCTKKQNAWLTPFDFTDYNGVVKCSSVYGLTGIWALNGCNTANTPVKSLVKLKDHLKPIDFSDINLRPEDQIDTRDSMYTGDPVSPNP